MKIAKIILASCAAALTIACSPSGQSPFVTVADGQFRADGKAYGFVGANFWYGAILGSQGEGGNRERLHRELDFLKSIGVDNLRILVGGDGPDGIPTRIEPTLQREPGMYNDEIFDGLDYLLAEMGKRKMYAVLYMNNSWEWSGGYSQYLEWSGEGHAPIPAVDGWSTFTEYVAGYAANEKAHSLFSQHIANVVTRTNRYTGKPYTEDTAIMAWQIGNEPRAFGDANKEPFARWIAEAAAQIKSLDPNHLVSIGSEGKAGLEGDMALFEKIHADPNIDYMTIHIWPNNWDWMRPENMAENLQLAIGNTYDYIDEHLAVVEKYRKPLVMEEFGYPRDGYAFAKGSSTEGRDAYYEAVFSYIHGNMQRGGMFAGCNIWGWGGSAELSPEHIFWQKGDDYTGDPAQEEQGLNSVFSSDDSTVAMIKKYSELLRVCLKIIQ